jgi:hypothetical protein
MQISGRNRTRLNSHTRPNLDSTGEPVPFTDSDIIAYDATIQNFAFLTDKTAGGNQAIPQLGLLANSAILPQYSPLYRSAFF